MLCRRTIGLMIWCMQSECIMSLLKELEQLKLSSSTVKKRATVDKFITKKHKEAVSHVEFTVTK